VSVEGTPVRTQGIVSMQLRFRNDGSGPAINVSLRSVVARVLGGTGTVAVLAPAAPYPIGRIDAGGSRLVPVQIAAGSSVLRVSLTESGTLQDETGATTSYAIATAVQIP
jgi:hypothetical protein